MKFPLSHILKITALTTIMMVGVMHASAFSGPTDVSAPVNTAANHQIKKGGITAKFFMAIRQPLAVGWFPMPTWDGVVLAKQMVKSYDALFTDQLFFSGSDSQVKIGSSQVIAPTTLIPTNNIADPLFDRSMYATPLTIDLVGRGVNNSTGKNAMELLSGNSCLSTVTTLVNTNAVTFQKKDGTPVDIVARQLRLTGGMDGVTTFPKVLISTNANGDAVWATVQVVNGQIIYRYSGHTPIDGDSPVTAGQLCQP